MLKNAKKTYFIKSYLDTKRGLQTVEDRREAFMQSSYLESLRELKYK